MSDALSRAAVQALDAADPLAAFVAEFALPEGLIYLNGNSLGPAPKAALERVAQSAHEEWANGLITSWNKAGWFALPYRLGDRVARLVGASPGEVVLSQGERYKEYRGMGSIGAMKARAASRDRRLPHHGHGLHSPATAQPFLGSRPVLGMNICAFSRLYQRRPIFAADIAGIRLTY